MVKESTIDKCAHAMRWQAARTQVTHLTRSLRHACRPLPACAVRARVGANRHGRVQDVHEVQGARVLRVSLSSLSTPLQDKPPPPATTGTRARGWRWREGATAEGVECGGEGGRNDQGSRGG